MTTTAVPIIRCDACGAKNRVPSDATGHPRCGKCHLDLPWLIDVDSSDFDRVVTESTLPVLVDCWAAWCGPCRSIAPIVETLSRDYAGRLKVVKLDVDRAPELSARLGVQGIPALFIYAGGNIVDRLVGAQPEHVFRQKIDAVLATRPSPTSASD